MRTIIKNLVIIFPTLFIVIPESFAGGGTACNVNITATAPDARYTDNADETVTDLWTGLMWKQCPEGTSGAGCATGTETKFTWQQALQSPVDVNGAGGFADHTDWRLPGAKEMLSLIEFQCYGAARNLTMFPNTVSGTGNFWTSTPSSTVATSGRAFRVYDLLHGSSLLSLDDVSFTKIVRLVRDAQ